MIAGEQTTAAAATQLLEWFGQLNRAVVALSGGVDSAVVASAAQRRLGRRAIAVTAVSPSLSAWQQQHARLVAAETGIHHAWLTTDEGKRDDYQRNDRRRCYFCKQTLYQHLREFAARDGGGTLVSGTNADDLGDYRPGLQAGEEAGVRVPLAELGFGKSTVRRLAAYWGLSVWDAPASPCLASRIAYGVEVTAARLRRIEAAEDFLRSVGFTPLRVRLHEGELARIEVPTDQLPRLLQAELWRSIVDRFRELGFQFVTVDLEGFRSGNLNQLVSISLPGTTS